jgi:lipopolysaccharide export system permease protein
MAEGSIMNRIHRYVWRQISNHIFMVTFAMMLILVLFTLLQELGFGLAGDYQMLEAFVFVLMSLPSQLYELFPLLVLIGCMTGLGAMANSSELTVMRSTGLSKLQISWMVMKPVIFLTLLALLLGETVIPEAEQNAQGYRAVKSKNAETTRYGVWHRDGDDFVFLSAISANGSISGVTRYRFDEELNMDISIAQEGVYIDDQWQLFGVSDISVAETMLEKQSIDRASWQTDVTPELLNTLQVQPDRLALPSLVFYIDYLFQQGIDTSRYELVFWRKILKPAVTIALVLVAISFIFGPLRSVATGTRVFAGVLVGLVLMMIQILIGPASLLYGFSPFLAAFMPIALCAALGLWLLRKSQ